VRRNNEVEEVRLLMAPPLERLEIYAVSTAVNNVRCTASFEVAAERRLFAASARPGRPMSDRGLTDAWCTPGARLAEGLAGVFSS
jgi:hypothetical protein